MIQVTSRGDRRQLKDNTEDIHNLEQKDIPQFERKYLQSSLKNSGGESTVLGDVVSAPEYDDPDRVYPTPVSWTGSGILAGGSWPLEDHTTYTVLVGTHLVYNPSTVYAQGDTALFTVLNTTVCTEPFADVGYGKELLYEVAASGGTTGTFDSADWELVDDLALGQVIIDRPIGWDEDSGNREIADVTDMRNYDWWFEIGAHVPLITILYTWEVDEPTYTLFDHALIYTGVPTSRSIAYNADEGRVMAVYR